MIIGQPRDNFYKRRVISGCNNNNCRKFLEFGSLFSVVSVMCVLCVDARAA